MKCGDFNPYGTEVTWWFRDLCSPEPPWDVQLTSGGHDSTAPPLCPALAKQMVLLKIKRIKMNEHGHSYTFFEIRD